MVNKEDGCAELIRDIEFCSLPKLTGDCDAGDHEKHYRAYSSCLPGHVGALRKRLAATDLSCYSQHSRVDAVSRILILIHELRSVGPWSPEGFNSFAASIEEAFTGNINVSLDRFAQDAGEHRQAIFDTCFANLHKKLTFTDWKKYPATIETYYDFSMKIQEYTQHAIEVEPVKVLPAALLLIDDFNTLYKHKGLDILLSVLHCLTEKSFQNSNYHQVIYNSLNRLMRDNDIKTLKLTFQCIEHLTSILSSTESQCNQVNTMIKDLIEDIYVATNLERKAISFAFLSKLISVHKSECISYNKRFSYILTDNLELCSSQNVRRVMLHNILLALKAWLRHCWVVWRYKTDKGILSLLFKLLYIQCYEKDQENNLNELEDITVCIIMLCSKEEQEKILLSLNDCESLIVNEMYANRIKHITQVCKEPR